MHAERPMTPSRCANVMNALVHDSRKYNVCAQFFLSATTWCALKRLRVNKKLTLGIS